MFVFVLFALEFTNFYLHTKENNDLYGKGKKTWFVWVFKLILTPYFAIHLWDSSAEYHVWKSKKIVKVIKNIKNSLLTFSLCQFILQITRALFNKTRLYQYRIMPCILIGCKMSSNQMAKSFYSSFSFCYHV